MRIRKYRSQDCPEMAELFFDTVHTVNAKDYSIGQLDAWADGNIDLEEWDRSFQEHYTVVAEVGGRIAGFGDIDRTGYIDRLYVHKDCQGQGIATAICDDLEKNVSAAQYSTHASITAKPFFIKRGYCVLQEQQVYRKGLALTNFIMEKSPH